jgi:hypothetical protein
MKADSTLLSAILLRDAMLLHWRWCLGFSDCTLQLRWGLGLPGLKRPLHDDGVMVGALNCMHDVSCALVFRLLSGLHGGCYVVGWSRRAVGFVGRWWGVGWALVGYSLRTWLLGCHAVCIAFGRATATSHFVGVWIGILATLVEFDGFVLCWP